MKHKILTILFIILTQIFVISCNEDDGVHHDNVTDLLDFQIVAADNGMLTIKTEVSSNVKLAEYCLFDEEYNVVCNFLNNVKDKNDALKETDGAFTVCFKETASEIPVNIYIFSILSEDGQRISKTIGEKYLYTHEGGFQAFDLNVSDDGFVSGNANCILADADGNMTEKTDRGTLISHNGIIIAFKSIKNDKTIELSCVVVKNADCSNIKF